MHSFLHWLFPAYARRSAGSTVGRGVVWVGLLLWSARYFVIGVTELGEDPGVMHGVHLVFHEAGHTITAMLTSHHPAVVFMGSGLQVLFPLIVAAAFYFKNRDAFGAAFGLWWAGHAALDVAPYIADARALELPLLGGGTGAEIEGHDWEYLLGHWNLLPQDTAIAAGVALAGRGVMAGAFLWGAAALYYERWVLVDDEPSSSEVS